MDTEAAVLRGIGITYVIDDLCTRLPCAEALWKAPTAEAWAALDPESIFANTLSIPDIIRGLQSDGVTSSIISSSALHSSFCATVICSTLHLTSRAIQHTAIFSEAGANASRNDLHRALVALSGDETGMFSRDRIDLVDARLSFHLAQISLFLSLTDLNMIGGRSTRAKAIDTQTKVSCLKQYFKTKV